MQQQSKNDDNESTTILSQQWDVYDPTISTNNNNNNNNNTDDFFLIQEFAVNLNESPLSPSSDIILQPPIPYYNTINNIDHNNNTNNSQPWISSNIISTSNPPYPSNISNSSNYPVMFPLSSNPSLLSVSQPLAPEPVFVCISNSLHLSHHDPSELYGPYISPSLSKINVYNNRVSQPLPSISDYRQPSPHSPPPPILPAPHNNNNNNNNVNINNNNNNNSSNNNNGNNYIYHEGSYLSLPGNFDSRANFSSILAMCLHYGMYTCYVEKKFYFDHVVLFLQNMPEDKRRKKEFMRFFNVSTDKEVLDFLSNCETLVGKYRRMNMPYLICNPNESIIERIHNLCNPQAFAIIERKLRDIPALKIILSSISQITDFDRNFTTPLPIQIAFPFPFAIPFLSYVMPITLAVPTVSIKAVYLGVEKDTCDVTVWFDGYMVKNKKIGCSVFKMYRQRWVLFFVATTNYSKNYKLQVSNQECSPSSYYESHPFFPPHHEETARVVNHFIITGNNFVPGHIQVIINNSIVMEEQYVQVLGLEIILLTYPHSYFISKVEVRSKIYLPDNQPAMESVWTGNYYNLSQSFSDDRLFNIIPFDLSAPSTWQQTADNTIISTAARACIAPAKLEHNESGWRDAWHDMELARKQHESDLHSTERTHKRNIQASQAL